MNRLWIRLSVAFVTITLLSVLVIATLADSSVNTEFTRFMVVSQVAQTSGQLVQYYDSHGGWAGVDKVLPFLTAGLPTTSDHTLLADAQGLVVYDSGSQRVGSPLADSEKSLAIMIRGGDPVSKPLGYLVPGEFGAAGGVSVVSPNMMFGGSTGVANISIPNPAQEFLDRKRATLTAAALAIGVLGITLGLIISRTVVAPLNRLTLAVKAFTKHQWKYRVRVKGPVEIRALAKAFNSMADGLQHAEMLRRNLIADIAHELRTPLAVMQANLAALLDGVYQPDPREFATLYDETCRVTRLVDDLRELANADAGQLDLRLEPVALRSTLEGAAAKFAIAAESEETQVVLKDITPAVHVMADRDRLMQVLTNLLANALRHTHGGTITLNTEFEARASNRRSDTICISIRDTGEGIAAEDLPYIFERFYRADKSRARASGNSGLGLAITKAWIEAMHGEIWVRSTPGAGSTFYFRLPAVMSSVRAGDGRPIWDGGRA